MARTCRLSYTSGVPRAVHGWPGPASCGGLREPRCNSEDSRPIISVPLITLPAVTFTGWVGASTAEATAESFSQITLFRCFVPCTQMFTRF